VITYGQDYPDPYAEDGAELLDDLHAVLTGYVVFPSETSSHAVTLWVAATHCLPAFEHATRLVIKSPEKRCGKSRLLLVIEQTAHDSLQTVNATVAAIFRFLALNEKHPPTLLLDEADSVFGTKIKAELNEDLRGLLNAGFERGKPTLRTVGPQHEPKKFPTFAMVALAGIGELPDTIEDRAVIINLARQAPNKRAKPYRSRRDGPRLREVHDRLAAWAHTMVDQLADSYPDLPVEDRAADLWEPLVAVADMAGGHWPDRARTAALVMTKQSADADVDRSFGVRQLADVRDVFDALPTVRFLGSAELVRRLRDIDDGPWHELDLTTRQLATRLSGFGVHPGHNTAKTERGYQLGWFTDAFSRYVPAERPRSVRASGTPGNTGLSYGHF
jgi:hypothetical protein